MNEKYGIPIRLYVIFITKLKCFAKAFILIQNAYPYPDIVI